MSSAFEVSDRYVDELCASRPLLATMLGVGGRERDWGDHGLDAVEAHVDLSRRYRTAFERHLDDGDFLARLAAQVTVGMIDESISSYEAGDHFRDLRHLGCTFHRFRSIFDVMPKETPDDWANIVARLETVGGAIDGYVEVLDEGRKRGVTVARRQADSVASQAERLGGEMSSYLLLLDDAQQVGRRTVALERAVDVARGEVARFAEWLRRSYLPDARQGDAAGVELYTRSADQLVGLEIDLDEAYQWGWQEFSRLMVEMINTGSSILPDSSLEEVTGHLENDLSIRADSTDELLEFVASLLSTAVAELAGTHFFVPDEIKPVTVQIAPPGGPLGVYYIGPSEDLSRPGGVWYAIGDQKHFPLYQHVSTAYHEGFPGHHLQIATARYRKDRLSRAHRLLSWYPGYGEGWAMYAEVLMGELGYLEDPRFRFGMLAKQMYRAARIVVDIGLHTGKRIPEGSPMAPRGEWDFRTAVEFMRIYGFRTPEQAEAEVLRYLGWPGQAIAYKLGERQILGIRDAARRRLGSEFDLTAFHAAILDHGSMRLDLLDGVVSELLPALDQ